MMFMLYSNLSDKFSENYANKCQLAYFFIFFINK